jgi:hypothetical protein
MFRIGNWRAVRDERLVTQEKSISEGHLCAPGCGKLLIQDAPSENACGNLFVENFLLSTLVLAPA